MLALNAVYDRFEHFIHLHVLFLRIIWFRHQISDWVTYCVRISEKWHTLANLFPCIINRISNKSILWKSSISLCSRSWIFIHLFYYRMHKMFTWSSAVRRNWPRRSWFYRRRFGHGIAVDASWRWRTAVSQCKQHGGHTSPEKDSLWYWYKGD